MTAAGTRPAAPDAPVNEEQLTIREAVISGIAAEMRSDPSIILIGQDIGEFGGPLQCTAGLLAEFGVDRMVQTPICESSMMSMAVGAAASGLRPVVDLMFSDMLPLVAVPLIQTAASLRYFTDGALTAPLVVRIFGWPLQRELTRLSREVITGSFMVLTLPGAALSLAHNLDIPLVAASNADLVALITRFEPVPPAVDNCGAHDWSELTQRMHYISHLFRAYDLDSQLADPPFTPAQVKLIQAGRLPDGAL